jgi:glycosyltransferase involved in cell wall biosynthesis
MVHSSTGLSVSIIVPVHNGGDRFRQCLDSLKKTAPQPAEIIVVADGDTDGSRQLAKAYGVQVLETPSRGGPALARNVGARKAKGDILFFIDADVTLSPDAVRQVTVLFEQEPDLTAVFGSYDDEPGEANFLSQYRNLLHHHVHQRGREDASTFWGACGAIHRETFLTIGGFDERYGEPSIEDIELGYRLKKAGHRIRLSKTLQVKHLKCWNFVSMLRTDLFVRALPWTELILRDGRFVNDLNTDMAGRVSVMLVFLMLSSLFLSIWQPLLLAGAALMAVTLTAVNAPLYRFFLRKRGIRFTLQSLPCHWLYFIYSGAAFAVGTVRHFTTQDRLHHRATPLLGGGRTNARTPMERR